MFRRKKTKGSKSKSSDHNDDSMVAPLTGPGGLSSSSVEPAVIGIAKGSNRAVAAGGGGSRFLPGRRQKNKIGEENASMTAGAAGSQQPEAGGAAAIIDTDERLLSQPRSAQHHHQQQQQSPQPQPQPSLGAASQAAKMNNKRASKNITIGNKVSVAESSIYQQQRQQHVPKFDALDKVLEMRDEHENNIRRPQYHRHTNTTDATTGRGWNGSNQTFPSGRSSAQNENEGAVATTTTTLPNKAPPVLIPDASLFKSPQLYMADARNLGGQQGQQQQQQQQQQQFSGVSPRGTAVVPRTRSGWSMQSNGSSAMNSEHYIQSLDNLPILRAGKVSCGWCCLLLSKCFYFVVCTPNSDCVHLTYCVTLHTR